MLSEKKFNALKKKKEDLRSELLMLESDINIEEVQRESNRLKNLKNNFCLTLDHIKLLQEMEFVAFPNGGDIVCLGVEGKRPFGNSRIGKDIARILGWELNEDGNLSPLQQKIADKLFSELPLAINQIIRTPIKEK